MRIGLVPSDLLATFETLSMTNEEGRADAARPLYRDLVAGRWRLDRVMYKGYSFRRATGFRKTPKLCGWRQRKRRR